MQLRHTIELMNSNDYKERLQAEWAQAKIRHEKLHQLIVGYEAGTLNFKPTCSLDLLKEQEYYMSEYLFCLEKRAALEGIYLPKLTINYPTRYSVSCATSCDCEAL